MNGTGFEILVVDDQQDYCDVMKMILSGKGYCVETCNNGRQALKMLAKKGYDLIVTDLSMPEMDGMELLQNVKEKNIDSEVILLTAYGTIEKAVKTMKLGAYSYVTKGNDPEELLTEIEKVRSLRAHKKSEKDQQFHNVDNDYMLKSQSELYKRTLRLAERAAKSDTSILILGESGSGKEVLASYIHKNSSRRGDNFLELNCQALSESILESELFGHEKGSFTGAAKRHIGLFEASNDGTLFLDEIGGVSLNLQTKLLKAIENKQIYRLGSTAPINVDFRLITATNRDLQKDMENEKFRLDLFYRISTIVLELPPLRERREDIPLFIDYFIGKYEKSMNKKMDEVPEGIRDILYKYDYPGNIRELKNVVERFVVLSENGEIKSDYLPTSMLKPAKVVKSKSFDFTGGEDMPLREYRGRAEKAYISQLMLKYPNDMNKVSEVLGITRRQLFNKVVEYGLK